MFSFAAVFSHIRQVSNHCPLDLPKPTSDCLCKVYSGRAAAWRKLSWAAVLSSWLPTTYQPRCYLYSHSENLMHFQRNKGCTKMHCVCINLFLKHPFNCLICEDTSDWIYTSKNHFPIAWWAKMNCSTKASRFGGKYPGGLKQVSEGGVRLYSRLPASKEQEGALQITWPSPQRIHKLTNTPSIQVLYSMHGFLGFWFIQKPYRHSPHLWF